VTSPLILALIVLALAVVAYLVLRRAAPRRDDTPVARRAELPASPPPRAAPSPVAAAPAAPLAAPPARPQPPELAAFQITHAQDLPPAQRDALTEALRHIPRPPRSLHQLISPEFLATATSVEMSELVMSEPLIAAKVLSTVNSPLYGLQRSVTSIGQAITFLGMNTVRSICLRYMLDESFKAGDPASQRVFERLWTASAVASELCSRLTKQLHMPDAGTLVTKVVLSFVGHMAVATLPQSRSQPALTDLSLDLVQRYSAQQQALGLCAPEIGRLLMAAWELPASIVQGVGDIDLALTHAVGELETAAATRRAVAYLSARLAERLAGGSLNDLGSWDLAADTAICTHHVAGYLQPQQLAAALQGVLKAPDTLAAVAQLLGKGAPPG
jgi:HD-like signal output (HDOD) protein